jgi:hypothetical protein
MTLYESLTSGSWVFRHGWLNPHVKIFHGLFLNIGRSLPGAVICYVFVECQMELLLDGVVRSSSFPLHRIHLVHSHLDHIQLVEFVRSH